MLASFWLATFPRNSTSAHMLIQHKNLTPRERPCLCVYTIHTHNTFTCNGIGGTTQGFNFTHDLKPFDSKYPRVTVPLPPLLRSYTYTSTTQCNIMALPGQDCLSLLPDVPAVMKNDMD